MCPNSLKLFLNNSTKLTLTCQPIMLSPLSEDSSLSLTPIITNREGHSFRILVYTGGHNTRKFVHKERGQQGRKRGDRTNRMVANGEYLNGGRISYHELTRKSTSITTMKIQQPRTDGLSYELHCSVQNIET